ncbi:hypothetical protein QFC19_003340 [Naganishia cerealis]|uniref:Uncharacterized protein n=1 Tax=Naganishia cerealis TaxID=610337 RepID=A0ACC2W487_9TREE|nr:hypothetical protein QFC19_003340 [Naganishia cerealis]
MSEVFAPAPTPESPLGRWRILSPKAGIRVSPYFLGGMSIGEAWKDFMGSMSKEQSFKLLDSFVEAGGNAIDTANNYQNEESEQWIGEWMEARGNRDQMVIATKYTTSYKAYALGKNEARNSVGNHKKSLYLSVRDSLKKLKTDYIDILYLHWWDHSTSIEEIMTSLHHLVQERKVLYLGISDTPAWIVAAANTFAEQRGLTPFVIYQGRWNVMIRDFEREILPMAQHFGLALAPWDTLGGGRLQSKKQLEERKKQGEKLRTMIGPAEQTEVEAKYSEVLSKIADAHQVDSVTTIALAYVMQKAPYVFPIVGGRKPEHMKSNIKALEIKLTDEQIKEIEAAFGRSSKPQCDPALPYFITDALSVSASSGPSRYNNPASTILPPFAISAEPYTFPIMTIYALYIYDRHCECIYYHDWHQTRKPQPPRQGGTYRRDVARYDEGGTGDGNAGGNGEQGEVDTRKGTVAGLPFDEQAKLVYGVLLSLRNMVKKLSGRDSEQFTAYRTSSYKFHLYTTPTNFHFIMMSDPLADSLRGVLRQLYVGPFVTYVVRNPLVDWDREGPEGKEAREKGVDNDLGARLQIGEKGWTPEEVMIESIDVYNPRPRLETVTEGRRRPRGPEWKRFVGLPMDVPARTGDGNGDVDQSTHLPLTATTTGKALVSALGEPSRKGGGIGWVDVWLEWEHVGGDGVGLHFSLEDPRGDEVVGAEEQRRGLGGVWDRAGGWVWGVCKMYATGKRADDSAGGS